MIATALLITQLLGGSLGSAIAVAADGPAAEAKSAEGSASDPLDYSTLSHKLMIETLRAGSHNGSKTNQYKFKVTMIALLSTPDERNKDDATRKNLKVELGTFGETKIEPLSFWSPNEKAKEVKEFSISGSSIRELAANTMSTLAVGESDLMIRVEVRMLIKRNKYMVWSEDVEVAKEHYDPIPATQFEASLGSDQLVTLKDDKGTFVRIKVHFDKNDASGKEAKKKVAAKDKGTADKSTADKTVTSAKAQ